MRSARELVVDNFAGGGGASTGIEAALGRPVDIAINHDPEALVMHAANHPHTQHYCENIWQVDPVEVVRGRPVGLAWFSPDCKHFSKAKGGKPRDQSIRALAWVVIDWAKAVRPRIIMLENVEEFAKWGPLLDDGRPCPVRQGFTFRRWCAQLQNLGYELDMRELRACDYGAPTTRKRLFIIARCDGEPIVWPEPTHGPGRLPYRTAAECIDWSIPMVSIFERAKHGLRPLSPATLRRIARGVMKYVVHNPRPFIVTLHGTQESHINSAARSIDEPLRTINAGGTHHALVAPVYINTRNGERHGRHGEQAPRVRDIQQPYGTITAQGSQGAIAAAFIAKHYGGHEGSGADLRRPVDTITAKDHHALVTAPVSDEDIGHAEQVAAFLLKYYGTDQDPRIERPLGTLTTKHRFALVTVHGRPITDIRMRMFAPPELFRAQGFPSDYVIDPISNGRPLTQASQVRMCGNSVCPPIAEALVRANYSSAGAVRRTA